MNALTLRVTDVPVTQNLFPPPGVEPALGRSFTADECRQRADAPQAVLLRPLAAAVRFRPSVVGSKLIFNNRAVTVAGVLPASFDFAALFAPGTSVDIFIPWPLTDETNRRGNTMTIIGRLKPGATVENARPEFALLAKQKEIQHPERNGVVPRLTPLDQGINGRVRLALLVLSGAVGVVMLIVCANLQPEDRTCLPS